jgi:hypothetical protein
VFEPTKTTIVAPRRRFRPRSLRQTVPVRTALVRSLSVVTTSSSKQPLPNTQRCGLFAVRNILVNHTLAPLPGLARLVGG